jgi:hypothetical protein
MPGSESHRRKSKWHVSVSANAQPSTNRSILFH